jgi:hypothetical protein
MIELPSRYHKILRTGVASLVTAAFGYQKILKFGFVGYVTAVFGVLLGFSGWHFDLMWLSAVGFIIMALGILIGFGRQVIHMIQVPLSPRYHKIMKIGFAGFVTTVFGVLLGFGGHYFDLMWLFIVGFVITALGLLIGFVSMICGWIYIFFFSWRDVPPAPPSPLIREDVVPTHMLYPHSRAISEPLHKESEAP